jgi:hypothetical protein
VEPVALFEYSLSERDLQRWDFALVITNADLVTQYKPYAFAALSRSLEVSLVSTFRIDPGSEDPETPSSERIAAMSRRIKALVLHGLGHLGGLGHSPGKEDPMRDFKQIGDLDTVGGFDQVQQEQLRTSLAEVADQRLEEEESFERSRALSFYLYALWLNRRELFGAVREARPWEFPLRLSRLSAGALASILILLLTAETWHLGIHQPFSTLIPLMFATVLFTTLYVAHRQRLLLGWHNRIRSEQSAVTSAAALLIVLCGMLVSFCGLFAVVLLVVTTVFQPEVVQSWVETPSKEIAFSQYVALAAFVSCIAILIGALGATFEEHFYFRHITLVDEEV